MLSCWNLQGVFAVVEAFGKISQLTLFPTVNTQFGRIFSVICMPVFEVILSCTNLLFEFSIMSCDILLLSFCDSFEFRFTSYLQRST